MKRTTSGTRTKRSSRKTGMANPSRNPRRALDPFSALPSRRENENQIKSQGRASRIHDKQSQGWPTPMPPKNISGSPPRAAMESKSKPDITLPAGLHIVIDTREKKPYAFPCAIRRALTTGDYSIAGMEATVAIERKTLEDFLNSITQGRKRFFREIMRLTKFPYRAVVIEADYTDVINEVWKNKEYGAHEKDVSAKVVMGTARSIEDNYGVPVHFLGDRAAARLWVAGFLKRVWLKER